MATVSDWKVPRENQPKPADYDYDLATAVASVVGVRAEIPDDAFTAQTLGTERAGNGVLIRDSGLVLTIGYLITEAESIWLTPLSGPAVPGHALAYDQETGFGLIQALSRLNVRPLPIGNSGHTSVGERVVVAGAGGLHRSVAARIVAKQEFAGYWEYVLDEAIFTSPSHPNWGGTAVIGPAGELIGIGSLQLEQGREKDSEGHLNMVVPIDLLESDPRRPAAPRPPQPAGAAVARLLCRGDRGPHRHHRRRRTRAGAEGRPAGGRRGAVGRRPRADHPRLAVPPHLVARQRRGRGAAAHLPRRPHLRAEDRLLGTQPLLQGAADALRGLARPCIYPPRERPLMRSYRSCSRANR